MEVGHEYTRRRETQEDGEEGKRKRMEAWKEPVFEGKRFTKEMCDLSDEGQTTRRRVRGKGDKRRETAVCRELIREPTGNTTDGKLTAGQFFDVRRW